MDIKDAFRLIPVRPQDWPLLGYQWRNEFFCHTRLPFGLRSSPYHFDRFAKLLLWIVKEHVQSSHVVQYLDDFWAAGVGDDCLTIFNTFVDVCKELNVPLAPKKLEGPTRIITFLGISLDAANQTMSLPPDKFEEIREELDQWGSRSKCTKRELLSLIGKLSFASKCIPAGRIFFRRLIDLSTTVRKLHHRIRLNEIARADIQWWAEFLPKWNGTAQFLEKEWTTADQMELWTDAATFVGAGGFWQGHWFFIPWPPSVTTNKNLNITWMELLPIVIAARLWGKSWCKQKITFHTDNQALVGIWDSGRSRSSHIMSLVRALFFVAAENNFTLRLCHIPGVNNIIADSISRNLQNRFRQAAPDADAHATHIPLALFADILPV